MRLFISWSGKLSNGIACQLRDWIPQVIQAVRPYVSSRDIAKGARWSADLAAELEQASFGIMCMTSDSLDAPWLHFEAGALSKKVDASNVVPLLFGVAKSEIEGPLVQFQSALFNKTELLDVLKTINFKLEIIDKVNALPIDRLERAFEKWWPDLEREVAEVIQQHEVMRDDEPRRDEYSMLEEVLDLLRAQQRLLSDPEKLLPPNYLFRTLRDQRSLWDEIASDVVMEPPATTGLPLTKWGTKDQIRFFEMLDRHRKRHAKQQHESDCGEQDRK